jgi:hypothetical protein
MLTRRKHLRCASAFSLQPKYLQYSELKNSLTLRALCGEKENHRGRKGGKRYGSTNHTCAGVELSVTVPFPNW